MLCSGLTRALTVLYLSLCSRGAEAEAARDQEEETGRLKVAGRGAAAGSGRKAEKTRARGGGEL